MYQFELIQAMAAHSGLSETVCARVVDAIRYNCVSSLEQGESVFLRAFCTFDVIEVPARVVMHPRTRQPMELPKRKKIVFRASQTLKHAVI